ncbi:MAG: glycoside hydrolase family 9 protein [Bacteroidaceae bacterium]|nr:glycoside hydrolase family 9 protein [Bacteroidaceae bacterium]
MKKILSAIVVLLVSIHVSAQQFKLNSSGYFNCEGIDVMAFNDFYPEGHQGGISLIMNGQRIATNGDIRLEPTPGQWQAVPKQLGRKVNAGNIETTLCYPDSSRHLTGFNPMIYPDLQLTYTVRLEAEGDGVLVTVDLDNPIPDRYVGKVGFNLEFFPGILFGKPWLMDSKSGIYPQQPNGPVVTGPTVTERLGNFHQAGKPLADVNNLKGKSGIYSPIVADDIVAEPYAVGHRFTSRPDDPMSKVTIESVSGQELKLYDGRMNHNNGWFVLRSEIPAGATKGAVRWRIKPTVTKGWMYKPVVQTSQIGYLTTQQKEAIIETDIRTTSAAKAQLCQLTAEGEKVVSELQPTEWGTFLRYKYYKVDFSSVKAEGMYVVKYGDSRSATFRIGGDVYDRGVWQPVIEYFLPVQMCHMRVNDKYHVWHDRCHMDDARMAPAGNHFDGYDQRPGISPFKAGDCVPGVNLGGWHDAGDFDLRIESQAGECYILSLAYEAFKPQIDVTSIDQTTKTCEIHQPDGRNDILQQIEHGALSIVGGYKALGRLYRGIICPSLRQYAMLGDAAAMTDHQIGTDDDRWIFTENNPSRELSTAAQMAATARVLKGFNDALSAECLDLARTIYAKTEATDRLVRNKAQAAAELYLTTGESQYLDYIVGKDNVARRSADWFMARVERQFSNSKDKKVKNWCKAYRESLKVYSERLAQTVKKTPYGVPYEPSIWGAGWDIQRFGFENYFLAAAYPDLFSSAPICNALNFVLGCHPGSNQASFASGVGAQSATVGYGLNRADWSYIPGGVISGTALIRPDFPELLTFPFLWQQTEYVLGGGSSHYMFLVLAVQDLLAGK